VALTLLGYPENSVGRLMTPHYLAVREEWTVQEVLDYDRAHGQDSETLNTIYVVDEQGLLIDDVRIREFLLAPVDKRVADLMDRRFVTLTATDDQQTAVAVFRQYDRTALPVTDTAGMLIGHWYLIDTGQSLEPFVRIYRFFLMTLIAQAIFLLTSPVVLYLFGVSESVIRLERLWMNHSTLLVTRVIVGQAAPLVLSWMIWRTLVIPHTMAATGLFYIALLGVFVGEILGKQILALTYLPF
jgi:hypothetical protein